MLVSNCLYSRAAFNVRVWGCSTLTGRGYHRRHRLYHWQCIGLANNLVGGLAEYSGAIEPNKPA